MHNIAPSQILLLAAFSLLIRIQKLNEYTHVSRYVRPNMYVSKYIRILCKRQGGIR